MWDLWWTDSDRVEYVESEAMSSSKTWNSKFGCNHYSNDRPTEVAAKTTMQYPSTSTSTSVVSFQSIAQPSYQPFQPPHSNGLGINPLGLFMKVVQDATSYNSE